MVESSVMVSLPQMVDLALHSPEVGAVNFNILHSLLHVIIQQVDLSNCQVEFRGNDSERIQSVIHSTGPGPTLHLTEYTVSSGVDGEDPGEGASKKAKQKSPNMGEGTQTVKEELVEKELRVIDQRKDSKEEPLVHPIPMVKLTSSSSTAQQTVVLVEPTQEGHQRSARVSVALSKTHFNNMEEEIEKLKEDVRELKELPANMGLFEALRNAEVDKSSPVLDMFQILALVKRVEAAETGINKLASMVEDLAREKSGVNLLSVGERASELQMQMRETSKLTVGTTAKEKIENLDQRVTALERTGGPIVTVDGDTTTMKELVTRVSKIALADGEDSAAVRIVGLENKFTEYAEHMATMDTVFTQQVNTLQSQFTDLEKEIGEIVERINSFTSTGGEAGGLGGDMGIDQEGVRDLYNKVLQMQEEMEKVSTTATQLMEDKEERQLHMDALLEQVELLKTIKADREDLQDALADKADTCAVNRKVSHAQFESACDDLSRSIEDALGKLTQQERLWQQALDDIQQEIGTKLDKLELTPLKEFVTNKLKILQDRLKALTALKQETEAAGTKSKFLRNVNCISCDKEVVMRKQNDPTMMPPPPALPPTKSMAPYLAYELDALRKQQKCAPHSRNMHHFENAMSGVKTGADDHICNRYCGGSHTVTTPQQRVTRLGHFLQQWGPETQPANEGQLRGTDGQWYKTREAGDEAPKIEHTESVDMDAASYQASIKSRPSMMVQGGILSARFGKGGKEGEGDAGPRKSSAGSPRASKDTGKKQEDNISHITFKPGDVAGERE